MVLGIRTKSRKSVLVQVDYIVNVQEIRPWPPSESLKSAQDFLLQWENGNEGSGSCTCSIGDGRIDFSEAFRLPLTLCREVSKKGAARDGFQKNYLEFNLYEARKEKASKGQLLGSAVINLADYGIIRDTITLKIPVNFKKSSKNSAQPVLYVNIQSFNKDSSSSSPKSSLSKEVSLDKDESESVSESMNEDDEETEIASFTDDDTSSSHSSRSRTMNSDAVETARVLPIGRPKKEVEFSRTSGEKVNSEFNTSSGRTSTDINGNKLSDYGSKETNQHPYSGSITGSLTAKVTSSDLADSETVLEANRRIPRQMKGDEEDSMSGTSNLVYSEVREKREQLEDEKKETILEVNKHNMNNKLPQKFPEDPARKQVKLRSDTLAPSKHTLGLQGSVTRNDKLKHLKSLQINFDSSIGDRPSTTSHTQITHQPKKVDVLKDSRNSAISYPITENKGTCQVENQENKINVLEVAHDSIANHEIENKDKQKDFSDKVQLESKIEMLQEELREAAALEAALYSVIAEHGSSSNKVHAPARRLSRFYFHALKAKSHVTMASAARTVISGLILISKACGNDVPRLTFWLSNAFLLRGIVSQTVGKLQLPSRPSIKSIAREDFDEWEEAQTLALALQRVEAWIFTRIVESVWWQTLTPYMQSAASKGSTSRKTQGKRHGLGDQDQGNFSINLWKRAFKDAGERLCPLRAGGHECGCLPVLARLVIEQLVSRLDVAMFNAILRESAEEMPMDPVSDPITDPKVLPVPVGNSSFGSGAQLKNAVGNWSRWLTDLFGIDDNDLHGDADELNEDGERAECGASFKAFNLLNALSDLMMLPFEMLVERSTREQVCPLLGGPLIRRVLNNFVPDEFCPNPIPEALLLALDSEDLTEADEKSVTSFPCTVSPTVYAPPSASSLTLIIGEVGSQTLTRSGSSVVRKSYTSDDELEELDSPITSVVIDKSRVYSASTADSSLFQKGIGGRRIVRYQLLREIWKDDDQ